jgi:hypothetical protein
MDGVDLSIHTTGASLCNFYRLYINKAIGRIQRVGTYVRSVIYTPTPKKTSLVPVVLGQAKAKIEAIWQETHEKIKDLKKGKRCKSSCGCFGSFEQLFL